MPTYVSLAQQGFWEPYQQLGQSLSRYRDRKDRNKERKEDVDWRKTVRNDELTQREHENLRHGKIDKLNLDTGEFALGEAKKKAGQETALQNFDINSLSIPQEVLPPETQGPPRPAINLDLNVPFAAQPPEIQQNLVQYAKDNKLPLQALTSSFQTQQSALTGRTPMPAAPPGMVPKEYEKDGVKFGVAPAGAPPKTVTDSQGRDWSQDAETGTWKLLPETRKTSEKVLGQGEVEQLKALDKAEAARKNLENQLGKVPWYLRGPVMGRAANLGTKIPFVRDMLPSQDIATTEQAIDALIGPIFRGVQGNVGIMDKTERANARSQGAELTDQPGVAKAKLAALGDQIKQARGITEQAFKNAGRDISGFQLDPSRMQQGQSQGGELPSFASEQEFLASPAAAGWVRQPNGQYRKAHK